MKLEIVSRDGKYKFYTNRDRFSNVRDIKEYLYQNLHLNENDIFFPNNCNNVKDSTVNNNMKDSTVNNNMKDSTVKNNMKDSTVKNNSKDSTVKNNLFSNIIVYNNSCLLDDNENLASFEYLNITFDLLKKDIKVKITGSDEILTVDSNQLISYGDKTILIKQKKNFITWSEVLKTLRKVKITRNDIVKFLAFGLLIFTNNSEILFIFSVIFFLQFISKMFITHNRKYSESLNYYSRTFMMFIASMFMIDHSRF